MRRLVCAFVVRKAPKTGRPIFCFSSYHINVSNYSQSKFILSRIGSFDFCKRSKSHAMTSMLSQPENVMKRMLKNPKDYILCASVSPNTMTLNSVHNRRLRFLIYCNQSEMTNIIHQIKTAELLMKIRGKKINVRHLVKVGLLYLTYA